VKPENTEIRILEDEVEFDGKVVKKIKYDLKHINQGWNDKARDYKTRLRSNYTGENVEGIFSRFGYLSIEWDEDQVEKVTHYGKKFRRFTTTTLDDDNVEVIIVIDVPVEFNNEATIVTIYKEGEE
jgi:hypothetical protein